MSPESAGDERSSRRKPSKAKESRPKRDSSANGNGLHHPKTPAVDLPASAPASPPPAAWMPLAYMLDEISLLDGKKSSYRPSLDRLREWVTASITTTGLLRESPSQTLAAAALLIDLRSRLVQKGWQKSDSKRLALMLNACSHSLFREGSLFFKEPLSAKLWKKRLTSLRDDKVVADVAQHVRSLLFEGKRKKSHRADGHLGIQCDECGWSVLRGEWNSNAPHLAIQTHGKSMSLEFRLRGQQVARGAWTTNVVVDGESIETSAPWENVGWNSDESGQYVEYRQDLGNGASLDRLIFLARPAGLLFLLDAIQGPNEANWRAESAWVTSPGHELKSTAGFRAVETSLADGTALRVLPLGAAPTLQEPSAGGIEAAGNQLRWWLESRGQRMAFPLVMGWDKKGLALPRPWRRLTVTNDGPVMTPSEAAAYRFSHQGKSVVLFRSLLGTRRMAFLGHQTFYETLIGEFKKDGTLKDWLSVDADPDTPWDYFGALTHRQHTAPHPHEVRRDR
ncbi:hypothetical protein K2X85_19515 [bacterium]|nr:hypothetical protein [bacterium]